MEDEDEMEEFLDDEGADGLPARRKFTSIAADLDPVSSGLCFENECRESVDSHGVRVKMSEYRMELLLSKSYPTRFPHVPMHHTNSSDDVRNPIDPFSDEYWPRQVSKPHIVQAIQASQAVQPEAPEKNTTADTTALSGSHGTLRPVLTNGNDQSGPAQTDKIGKPAKFLSSARLLTGPELAIFKQEVAGSDHNKAVLVGLLKKRFPKVVKAGLLDTLAAVAERRGRNESDKKWFLKC